MTERNVFGIMHIMLTPAQIKKGLVIVHEKDPFVVVESSHHKMGRGGAVARVKIKSLKNDSMLEVTYQGNDKIEQADLEYKRVQFLYKDDVGAYFMDKNFEQFSLNSDMAKDSLLYLKDGQEIDIAFFEGNVVSIKLPPKVDLKVLEAPPAVKGDTANNATKLIKLETGLTIQAPLFIDQSDVVRVNTETGEYVERA